MDLKFEVDIFLEIEIQTSTAHSVSFLIFTTTI